jgi:hypothetical protein
MLKLEDLNKDAQIRGLTPEEIVRIVQVEPHGEHAVTVIYRDSQGPLRQDSCPLNRYTAGGTELMHGKVFEGLQGQSGGALAAA